jgi:hypothetical protein
MVQNVFTVGDIARQLPAARRSAPAGIAPAFVLNNRDPIPNDFLPF